MYVNFIAPYRTAQSSVFYNREAYLNVSCILKKTNLLNI